MKSPTRTALTLLTLTCLLLPGCLERKETIVVSRDGKVRMTVVWDGDSGDFDGPALAPSELGGWKVETEERTKDDGKEEKKLTAVQQFDRDEPLPETYATERDDEAVAMRFPTSLTIEKRRDGVYYHFERRYEPRPMARYKFYQDMVQQALKELLDERDFSELSPEEKLEAVKLFRNLDVTKNMVHIDAALEEVGEDWPQDRQLKVRNAFRQAYHAADLEVIVEMLDSGDTSGLEALTQDVHAEARDNAYESLARNNVRREEIDNFFAALDTQADAFAVSEDLGDEQFEIRLTLPGELVAHDGDEAEGNTVTWRFPGNALMDRTQTIRATSRHRR